METSGPPIFSAVSNITHQLYVILRCIGFTSKSAIQITPQGIRFSADDGRVMQGITFLDKNLFTNYAFSPPSTDDDMLMDAEDPVEDITDTTAYPRFLVSLSALIETLQIFGFNDSAPNLNSISNPMASTMPNAFSTPALSTNRTCALSYLAPGSPLCITLTEASVTTTCELTTYDPEDPSLDSPEDADIPFQRESIAFKIIMRSLWLHNAIMELDSTNPTVLTISASPDKAPFFALSASGGPFGESTVEFSIGKEPDKPADLEYKAFNEDGSSKEAKRGKLAPSVAETFMVNPHFPKTKVRHNYRFALVRKALRAMSTSSKVSIRGDSQGVLSMQFMIELGDTAADGSRKTAPTTNSTDNVSFVDFRFVPLVDDEENGNEPSEPEE